MEKYNEVFGLTCTPLEDIPNNKKLKLIRDNLVIHYIDIRNKNIHDLFKNYKSDIRRKIRSDAIITRNKKIALGVVTADCVPILLYDIN